MNKLWMITYDISDNVIRRQVSELLLNQGGRRVQYSVFECYIDAGDFDAFRRDIGALLEAEDSVRWYPLCRWCEKQIIWQGEGKVTENTDYFEV